jgi:phosphoribosylaminoimidazolecarboxamide formyltransferase/IMP cyclohydrolase
MAKKSEKHALISVYDKTNIVDFAKKISSLGFRIISTGGTAKALVAAGIKVIPIQEITGNPESFDGRMKTISFQIEGGILYDRKNSSHIQQARNLKIPQIDIVVANLYPFEKAVSNAKASLEDAIENIDVGGPTMVRAAAKNFKNVLVIVDPNDYEKVASLLKRNASESIRKSLAAKAFAHLSFYDSQIAKYLGSKSSQFPDEVTIAGRKTMGLRYGENPHQNAAVYIEPNTSSPLSKLSKISGRELSATNVADIAAGLESVRIFKEPAAAVIKHNSPSGVAVGSHTEQALERAVAADPVSAFGGVVVLNRPIDLETAKAFANFKEESGVLIDIIAAPGISKEATNFIKGVRKTTGIYTFGKIPPNRPNSSHLRFFDGGFILQDWDDTNDKSFASWKTVTKTKPTKKQLEQMRFAWKVIGRVRSNSVLIIDKSLPMTRGIGSGQTSRVRAVEIALEQAGRHAKGAVLASDSFFPFDDSVKLAAKYGVSAIVQQGGSLRDKDSVKAADRAGIAMVLTGERKFWH